MRKVYNRIGDNYTCYECSILQHPQWDFSSGPPWMCQIWLIVHLWLWHIICVCIYSKQEKTRRNCCQKTQSGSIVIGVQKTCLTEQSMWRRWRVGSFRFLWVHVSEDLDSSHQRHHEDSERTALLPPPQVDSRIPVRVSWLAAPPPGVANALKRKA